MKALLIRVRKHQQHIFNIFFVVLVVLFVITVVSISLLSLRRNIEVSQVKDALSDIASDMEDVKAGGNGYPATIPIENVANSEEVIISGGSNFNGMLYCISGTSRANNTVKYYIDSTSEPKEPKEGSCDDKTNETTASVPGGIAVAYVDIPEIKVVWNEAPFASSYRLQCSSKASFENAKTYETDSNYGVCENLEKGREYYLRVSSVNSLGYSAWSKPLAVGSIN